jgi:hypothetical protein
MYLSIFASAEEVAAEALTIDPASLYHAFEQVADGRKKKGRRYPLPLLLTLLLLGKLAGETSVKRISLRCIRTWSISLMTLMPSKRSGSMHTACTKGMGGSSCGKSGAVRR